MKMGVLGLNNYILVDYNEDFGRMGSLSGLFITTQNLLNSINGKTVYYGEILGKHSDVDTDEAFDHCKVTNLQEDELHFFIKFFGQLNDNMLTISGTNPVECYLEQDDGSEEDDDD